MVMNDGSVTFIAYNGRKTISEVMLAFGPQCCQMICYCYFVSPPAFFRIQPTAQAQ
jgi:hypothetical protein